MAWLCCSKDRFAQFPVGTRGGSVAEPTVAATVIVPNEYVGAIMSLCVERRGEMTEHTVLGTARVLMRCTPNLGLLVSGAFTVCARSGE